MNCDGTLTYRARTVTYRDVCVRTVHWGETAFRLSPYVPAVHVAGLSVPVPCTCTEERN